MSELKKEAEMDAKALEEAADALLQEAEQKEEKPKKCKKDKEKEAAKEDKAACAESDGEHKSPEQRIKELFEKGKKNGKVFIKDAEQTDRIIHRLQFDAPDRFSLLIRHSGIPPFFRCFPPP